MSAFAHPMLPASLQVYYHNMSVSRNTWKLRIDGSEQCQPGDIISFTMPSGMVNLNSVRLHFNAKTKQNSAGTGAYCRLSKGVTSAFDTINCESSGVVLDSGIPFGWNRYVQTVNDYTQKPETYKKVLENEFDWADWKANVFPVVAGVAYAAGPPVVAPVAPVAAAPTGAAPFLNNDDFVLSDWKGTFIGTAEQRLVDFTLFQMKVYIKWAAIDKAYISDNISQFSAAYDKVHVTLETVALNDGGVYTNALLKKLQDGETIDIKYQRVRQFSEGARAVDGTLTVGIATQSLSGLMGIFFDPASSDATKSFEIAGTDANVFPKNKYFKAGLGAGNDLTNGFFTVQNVQVPNFTAPPAEMFTITQVALKEHERNGSQPWLSSMDNYKQLGGALFYVRFDFPEAEKVLRLRSGINLLGTTAVVSYTTAGTTTTPATNSPSKILWALTDPVLKIGQGRQIELLS